MSRIPGILKPCSPQFKKKTLNVRPQQNSTTSTNRFFTMDEEEVENPKPLLPKRKVSFNDSVDVILIESQEAIKAKFAEDKKRRKKARKKEQAKKQQLLRNSPSLKPVDPEPPQIQLEQEAIDRFQYCCAGTSSACASWYLRRSYGDINGAVNAFLGNPHLYAEHEKNAGGGPTSGVKTTKVLKNPPQQQQPPPPPPPPPQPQQQ